MNKKMFSNSSLLLLTVLSCCAQPWTCSYSLKTHKNMNFPKTHREESSMLLDAV